ncbi:hypothetical protein JCM3766R1_005518 [Sporobolomyces carnicolor]
MPDTSSIPDLVASSFSDSLEKRLIHLYDYESTSKVPLARSSGHQFVHVVPGLAAKPAVPLHTPDLSKVTKRDPFEGPEYGPGEKILDLEASTGARYVLLHNLHALMREHFMAVPRFDADHAFRPQTSKLVPSDLEIANLVVQSYAQRGRNLICFFNGGPLAGASQPHLHLQFCPYQHDVPPLMQVVASSLTRDEDDDDDDDDDERVDKLNLPWIVFCVRLPQARGPTTTTPPATLHRLYEKLLDAATTHLASLDEASLPPAGHKRDSHNVFVTSTHVFLTPRRHRLVAIARDASIEQGRRSLGGGWEDVAGAEKEMRLSVNGLSVIGYWYVGSREEEDDLRTYGLDKTLKECGYVNEDYQA